MLSERFEMRFSPELLKLIDDWRRKRPQLPSRADAIRQLTRVGLLVDTLPDIRKAVDAGLDALTKDG